MDVDRSGELKREGGDKIKLTFGAKAKEAVNPSTPPEAVEHTVDPSMDLDGKEIPKSTSPPAGVPTPPPEKVTLKMSTTNKPKNVFASVPKKSALGGSKGAPKEAPQRPMCQAEKIMKEELERKRKREEPRGPGLNKKPRVA